MKKYPVKIQARIEQGQYEKILESGVDKSEYIRDAIDFFDCDAKKQVEISKIELLDELQDNVLMEDEHFEEFIKKHSLKKKNIMNTLKEEYQGCYDRLEQITKEEKICEELNLEKPEKRSREEIIMEILPTLQGFYYSETGITHDKLRKIGHKVKISPEVLNIWVNQNKELVKGRSYRQRNVLKHKDTSITRADKKDEPDDESI